MPDTKKTQKSDIKSAKSSKEEMPKGNPLKLMSKKSDRVGYSKSEKKASTSSSR